MIRINLLPVERRKREAGMWPRVAGAAALALFVGLAGAMALWTGVEASRLDGEVASRKAELERARVTSADITRLEGELAPLRRKADIVARVEKARRVTWSRRLDRVASILDREAPRVWLTSVRGADRGMAGSGPEATLELGCEAAPDAENAAPMGEVTGAFVEALRRAFVGAGGDFTRFDDRYAEKASPRPGTVEGWSNAFTVKLLRDREGR